MLTLPLISFSTPFKTETDTLTSIEMSDKKLRKKLVKTALKYEGTKYRGGGTTDQGMDCSGLIYTVFEEHGISLPRSSIDQGRQGRDIELKKVKKGDLLFFNNNPKRNVINHVGMVIEIDGDEIIFIHTSSQSGVIISSLKEPYHMRTFVKAKAILD
jgi:cell wall-associated NlpC family hydrolase